MHELSIAMNLVEVASEAAEENGGGRVSAVYLTIGALSGVVKDALLFSWELAVTDTPLEGAKLLVKEQPVIVNCGTCDAERELESSNTFICPVCSQPAGKVVSGKELEITALELE